MPEGFPNIIEENYFMLRQWHCQQLCIFVVLHHAQRADLHLGSCSDAAQTEVDDKALACTRACADDMCAVIYDIKKQNNVTLSCSTPWTRRANGTETQQVSNCAPLDSILSTHGRKHEAIPGNGLPTVVGFNIACI